MARRFEHNIFLLGDQRSPSYNLDEKLTALTAESRSTHPMQQAATQTQTSNSLRRRTVPGSNRPRDKSERIQQAATSYPNPKPGASVSSQQSPSSLRRQKYVMVSRTTPDVDPEDFSRRLKISLSPSPRPSQSTKVKKLFNPHTDPILNISESGSTGASRLPPSSSNDGDERDTARHLFDHQKDDPIRFSVIARPQQLAPGHPSSIPKSSRDHVSASSTSSYATSISSNSSTSSPSLSSDESSTSSLLFDGRPNRDRAENGIFALQVKKLYREISNLETKVMQENSMNDSDGVMSSRVVLKVENDDLEKEKWRRQICLHKILAENIHNLLKISSSPSVPPSLRIIPTKYNIIVRLWAYAFHKLLKSLYLAAFSSPLALEHLQDFIYYAYIFYTGLLEEPTLVTFKSGWLEALGDLAWYRMAVAEMVNDDGSSQWGLTVKAVSEADAGANESSSSREKKTSGSAKSISDASQVATRIDHSHFPSIGLVAAHLLEVEPEKERWRNIAMGWYAAGIAEQPGTGKLHHHMGLLSREVEGEELQSVYHLVKSITTLHPFLTSHESILSIWSHAAQARRCVPDAKASDLFILLHGMLFTNIQLDNHQPTLAKFQSTLARFIERLEIEGAEEREWIMMGIINIASIMEYGSPGGVLRKVGFVVSREVNGHGPQTAIAIGMRVQAKKVAAGILESKTVLGGVDEEKIELPTLPEAAEPQTGGTARAREDTNGDSIHEHPPAFKFALQLVFQMLSSVLRHPTRKPSQSARRSTLNPYLIIILTFLATVLKHRPTLETLERSIPWADLASFFTVVPRNIMISQGLMVSPTSSKHDSAQLEHTIERWNTVTGMLTSGCALPLPEDWCLRGMEWVGMEVFGRGFWKSGEEKKAEFEVLEMAEGKALTDASRWVRIIRCGVNIAGAVDGFNWVKGSREWNVEGKLAEKVTQWKEEDQAEREVPLEARQLPASDSEKEPEASSLAALQVTTARMDTVLLPVMTRIRRTRRRLT